MEDETVEAIKADVGTDVGRASKSQVTAQQLVFVYRIIFGVSTEGLAELLAKQRTLEATLPIIDPTRWRKEYKTLEQEIKVTEKFLALRLAIDECLPVLDGGVK